MSEQWRVEMAEIVKAVGLRGEVKMLLTGDFLEETLNSRFVRRWENTTTPTPIAVEIENHRWKGDTVIVKFADLTDRNAAESAVGQKVGFMVEDYDDPEFPRPEEPAPFLYDGLTVETTGGEVVGHVAEVMVLPANLVLRVERAEREDEVLIPVIPPVVKELDRSRERLVIEPIPGLLDDASTEADS